MTPAEITAAAVEAEAAAYQAELAEMWDGASDDEPLTADVPRGPWFEALAFAAFRQVADASYSF